MELTGRESRFSWVPIASRIARLPLDFPVVGGASQAGQFGDSQRRIARGNDLKGDSNATIRVTDVGVGMCQASAIPTANIEHQQTSLARYPSISKVC